MRSATRQVTVTWDAVTVAEAVRAGLASLGATVTEELSDGRVSARTGSSGRSWGERITVAIVPVAGGARVDVHVETVVGLTLLDYGATRRAADHLVRAVSDPAWAQRVAAGVGRPVFSPAWLWFGLAAVAGAAALARQSVTSGGRTALLVAAGVSAVLWTAAVLTRSLRVRRRGQFVPASYTVVMMVGTLGVGLSVADALKPRHPGLAVSTSADLSSVVGSLALTALVVAAVRTARRRGSTGDDRDRSL